MADDALRRSVEERMRYAAIPYPPGFMIGGQVVPIADAVSVAVAMIEEERRRLLLAANDLHVSARHDGHFDDCPKHKCVHLRESVKR